MKLPCSMVSVCLNYSTRFLNDDFSSFKNYTNDWQDCARLRNDIPSSKLIVRIYKLAQTALKTNARVIKVKHDPLHILYRQIRATHNHHLIFLTGIHTRRWRDMAWHLRVVRDAVHSGKKWCSALRLNAKHSGESDEFENSYSVLYILLKSWLCCCSLATLATQQ